MAKSKSPSPAQVKVSKAFVAKPAAKAVKMAPKKGS